MGSAAPFVHNVCHNTMDYIVLLLNISTYIFWNGQWNYSTCSPHLMFTHRTTIQSYNGIEQWYLWQVLAVAAVVTFPWSSDHKVRTWQVACNYDIATSCNHVIAICHLHCGFLTSRPIGKLGGLKWWSYDRGMLWLVRSCLKTATWTAGTVTWCGHMILHLTTVSL